MLASIDQVVAVALVGLLEGLGIPWPGAVVVAAAGVAVAGAWPDLLFLTALFGVAYSVGALGQYLLGRLIGPRALIWMPSQYRKRVDTMMTRYGPAAVLVTRPFVVGNYVSAPAGIMKMPLGRFLPATFFGVAPWALSILLSGGLLAAHFGGLQEVVSTYLVSGVAALALLAVAGAAWKRLRKRRVLGLTCR